MGEVRIRLAYVALAIVSVAIGLLLRWPALGLPWAVGKYGGSALWGAMVYFGLRVIVPRARVRMVQWWPPCWWRLARRHS